MGDAERGWEMAVMVGDDYAKALVRFWLLPAPQRCRITLP